MQSCVPLGPGKFHVVVLVLNKIALSDIIVIINLTIIIIINISFFLSGTVSGFPIGMHFEIKVLCT